MPGIPGQTYSVSCKRRREHGGPGCLCCLIDHRVTAEEEGSFYGRPLGPYTRKWLYRLRRELRLNGRRVRFQIYSLRYAGLFARPLSMRTDWGEM